MLLIAASILAARKLAQYDSGARVPATVSAIADGVRWQNGSWRRLIEGTRRSPFSKLAAHSFHKPSSCMIFLAIASLANWVARLCSFVS